MCRKYSRESQLLFLPVSTCSLWQKIVDKFLELGKIGFSVECFAADFFAFFFQKTTKFGYWVHGWLPAVKSKHFKYFLEIPNFLRPAVLRRSATGEETSVLIIW